MTRVAAFDCGTNSLRLLIADVDPATRELAEVDRRMEIVRLGEGVDRTGRIAPAALDRTLRVTRDYADRCRAAGVARTRFVATSASRDASNRGEFTAGVRALLGVEPEVISGMEEAALSFAGATAGLRGHPAPYLVVDVGGGSTEIVLGDTAVWAGCSIDVGCVRLTERHLHADPPTEAQIAAATRDIDSALDDAERTVAFGGARTLVGLAGSVTTVTARVLGLDAYRAEAIHQAAVGVPETLAACADLLAATRSQRAALPYMHPGRVDVIGAGALVWSRIVGRAAHRAGISRVVASEHDILDGIALALA